MLSKCTPTACIFTSGLLDLIAAAENGGPDVRGETRLGLVGSILALLQWQDDDEGDTGTEGHPHGFVPSSRRWNMRKSGLLQAGLPRQNHELQVQHQHIRVFQCAHLSATMGHVVVRPSCLGVRRQLGHSLCSQLREGSRSTHASGTARDLVASSLE